MTTKKIRLQARGCARLFGKQEQGTIRPTTVVYGSVAVLAVVIAVLAVRTEMDPAQQVQPNQPSSSPSTDEAAAPVGVVTFDGSACSMDVTVDRIEAGVVLVEAVNATPHRAMFDSYELLEGYSVQAFAATIERDRARAEPWIFPSESEVRYLASEVVPANSSHSVLTTMASCTVRASPWAGAPSSG